MQAAISSINAALHSDSIVGASLWLAQLMRSRYHLRAKLWVPVILQEAFNARIFVAVF